MTFDKNQNYAWREILQGLDAADEEPYYALHKGNDVLGFALNRWQNPNAPSEILVGYGEAREQYADYYIAKKPRVPVFIRESKEDRLQPMIDRALAQLPMEHQSTLALHEREKLEFREISNRMGCSIGTVMTRLFYARRKMAHILASYENAQSGWCCAGYFGYARHSDDTAEKNQRVKPLDIPSIYKILFLQEIA